MRSKDITAVIATMGRSTLGDAIFSAQREFENVIVVADAVDLNFDALPQGVVTYLKVGRKNHRDHYGGVAWNMAAYAANTPYITQLGDDDEFNIGCGEFMQSAIDSNPDVDIWIPGLRYNDGHVVCLDPGLCPGNVAAPTFKTELFFLVPFSDTLIDPDAAHPMNDPAYVDFIHVSKLIDRGASIAWYGREIYLVRPQLPGTHGVGQMA